VVVAAAIIPLLLSGMLNGAAVLEIAHKPAVYLLGVVLQYLVLAVGVLGGI
jgi:hypothetical protein